VKPERKPAAFDTSVVVAALLRDKTLLSQLEPVLQSVKDGRRPGLMSFVNATEVQYVAAEVFSRMGQDVFDILKELRIEVGGVNKAQALLAADAKRKVPDLSLGDAFAFSLAAMRDARLFTSDPGFDHPWIRARTAVTLLRRAR